MTDGILSGGGDGTELERLITTELNGPPDLNRAERRRFLGELQERVLVALTRAQTEAPTVQREFQQAVADPRAKAVIAHIDIPYEHISKYSRIAQEHGVPMTRRSDPAFVGNVGLIVVSDQAVTPLRRGY